MSKQGTAGHMVVKIDLKKSNNSLNGAFSNKNSFAL